LKESNLLLIESETTSSQLQNQYQWIKSYSLS